jgi:hypothetical protein
VVASVTVEHMVVAELVVVVVVVLAVVHPRPSGEGCSGLGRDVVHPRLEVTAPGLGEVA